MKSTLQCLKKKEEKHGKQTKEEYKHAHRHWQRTMLLFSDGYHPTKYSSWKSSNLEFGFDMKIKKSMSNVVYIKNYCATRIINRALTLLSVSTWVNTTPISFTAPWSDRDNLNALVFIYFSLVLVRWAHFPLYCKVYKSISIV